jgi:hypothetical protein
LASARVQVTLNGARQVKPGGRFCR